MKKACLLLILTSLSLLCCTTRPVIPISDTLEIALGNRYSSYVKLLNQSAENDTIALKEFLSIGYVYDAAGYDHGWILVQLMERLGDNSFSNALRGLEVQNLKTVKEYFRVGIDGSNSRLIWLEKYPLTFSLLGFTADQLK